MKDLSKFEDQSIYMRNYGRQKLYIDRKINFVLPPIDSVSQYFSIFWKNLLEYIFPP